uniref:EGF-like domain-containing protein n=1 Tax=Heterorhabditis bacteriophora TaxID=37862 RepID=A0A1I7WJJ3_HETBA
MDIFFNADRCFGPNYCQNYGFPDVNNCSQCICPSGFGGQYCNSPMPYYRLNINCINRNKNH